MLREGGLRRPAQSPCHGDGVAPQNRLSDGVGRAWGASEAVTGSSEPCEGQGYRSMTPWCRMTTGSSPSSSLKSYWPSFVVCKDTPSRMSGLCFIPVCGYWKADLKVGTHFFSPDRSGRCQDMGQTRSGSDTTSHDPHPRNPRDP